MQRTSLGSQSTVLSSQTSVSSPGGDKKTSEPQKDSPRSSSFGLGSSVNKYKLDQLRAKLNEDFTLTTTKNMETLKQLEASVGDSAHFDAAFKTLKKVVAEAASTADSRKAARANFMQHASSIFDDHVIDPRAPDPRQQRQKMSMAELSRKSPYCIDVLYQAQKERAITPQDLAALKQQFVANLIKDCHARERDLIAIGAGTQTTLEQYAHGPLGATLNTFIQAEGSFNLKLVELELRQKTLEEVKALLDKFPKKTDEPGAEESQSLKILRQQFADVSEQHKSRQAIGGNDKFLALYETYRRMEAGLRRDAAYNATIPVLMDSIRTQWNQLWQQSFALAMGEEAAGPSLTGVPWDGLMTVMDKGLAPKDLLDSFSMTSLSKMLREDLFNRGSFEPLDPEQVRLMSHAFLKEQAASPNALSEKARTELKNQISQDIKKAAAWLLQQARTPDEGSSTPVDDPVLMRTQELIGELRKIMTDFPKLTDNYLIDHVESMLDSPWKAALEAVNTIPSDTKSAAALPQRPTPGLYVTQIPPPQRNEVFSQCITTLSAAAPKINADVEALLKQIEARSGKSTATPSVETKQSSS